MTSPNYPPLRRRHPRISVRDRCWCEGEGITIYAQMVNLSQEGLFIRTSIPLKVGAKARISWSPSNAEEKVVADVEVVWHKVAAGARERILGMGLRIIEVKSGGSCLRKILSESEIG